MHLFSYAVAAKFEMEATISAYNKDIVITYSYLAYRPRLTVQFNFPF